jgi:hypothetical protein
LTRVVADYLFDKDFDRGARVTERIVVAGLHIVVTAKITKASTTSLRAL